MFLALWISGCTAQNPPDQGSTAQLEFHQLDRAVAAANPSVSMFVNSCLAGAVEFDRFRKKALEHGWVEATEAGRDLFPNEMMVYHWHSEGFGLPEGAELLATGSVFPHQAYHIDDRIWGIQFHPEVDDETHERWLSNSEAKTDRPNGQGPDEQRVGRQKFDAAFGEWFERFAAKVLAKDRTSADMGRGN